MQQNESNLIEFCQELLKTPSLAGKEDQVAMVVREELQKLGFPQIEVDEFGNVVATISNGPGPTVVFDAHLDTVTVEPLNSWQFSPYGGWVDDGKIYGRGAVDEKGPAAAMIYGLAELIESKEFSGSLVLCLSTLEEVSEGAALASVLDRYAADMLVICEPSNLRLIRGQRGRAEIVITVHGIPTHSSTPHLGRNAVEIMSLVIEKMHNMTLPTQPLLGKGVQVLTDIISKPYPATSMVPHRCRATFDRRLMVGETEESVLAELNAKLAKLRHEEKELNFEVEIASESYKSYTGHKYQFDKFLSAWELAEDHAMVIAGQKALQQAIGKSDIGCYQFCTNGSLPDRHAAIPKVGFGPGDENLAHRIDEYIIIDDLLAGARGFTALASAFSRLQK
jgi:putative selenium metabolism hydrolase